MRPRSSIIATHPVGHVIGPRSSHVTQAGPIRVSPWDLYILKQGDRSSLFHLKSLTWNDVAWPYPLPTIKKELQLYQEQLKTSHFEAETKDLRLKRAQIN